MDPRRQSSQSSEDFGVYDPADQYYTSDARHRNATARNRTYSQVPTLFPFYP